MYGEQLINHQTTTKIRDTYCLPFSLRENLKDKHKVSASVVLWVSHQKTALKKVPEMTPSQKPQKIFFQYLY